MQPKVTDAEIRAAYPALQKVAHRTPLMTCVSLTERCHGEPGSLLLKMENQQRTGSFKIRGAYHRLSAMPPEEKAQGVVAASAGNHAQGVALAGRLTGIRTTVFMPEFASIAKIAATQRYGAEVVLEG